jgi:hypothetical protein
MRSLNGFRGRNLDVSKPAANICWRVPVVAAVCIITLSFGQFNISAGADKSWISISPLLSFTGSPCSRQSNQNRGTTTSAKSSYLSVPPGRGLFGKGGCLLLGPDAIRDSSIAGVTPLPPDGSGSSSDPDSWSVHISLAQQGDRQINRLLSACRMSSKQCPRTFGAGSIVISLEGKYTSVIPISEKLKVIPLNIGGLSKATVQDALRDFRESRRP